MHCTIKLLLWVDIDDPTFNVIGEDAEAFPGAGAGNAVAVLDSEQGAMGRAQDMLSRHVQKLPRLEVQGRPYMRTTVYISIHLAAPADRHDADLFIADIHGETGGLSVFNVIEGAKFMGVSVSQRGEPSSRAQR